MSKCKVYMTKTDNIECHGCKISMFCTRKDKDAAQPCDTNLVAVGVAFVLPLACIVLILFLAQGRVGEGWAALAVLLFLSLYFLVIRMLKIDFGKHVTKK